MVRTRAAALTFVLLLLAACSSPDASGPGSGPEPSGGAPTVDATEGGMSGHDHGSHGFGSGGSDDEESHEDHMGGSDDDGEMDSGASDDGMGSGDPSGEGSASDTGSGGSTGATQAAYPAAGTYVYAQEGSEAFCDPAGRCERHDLPARQKIATSYGQRTQTEAMVVTEMESGNGRYVRTTMHFTPGAGFVNEVYYRLVYEGLTLEEQYNPDPPVPQLRFPLRAGREWKASWKAGTSGDYHARVTGVEAVNVGAKTIDAYRVETLTNFRGDLKGKASIVTWIDARKRAVVATNGALNLSASYGSYNTNFQTSLRSAPGY